MLGLKGIALWFYFFQATTTWADSAPTPLEAVLKEPDSNGASQADQSQEAFMNYEIPDLLLAPPMMVVKTNRVESGDWVFFGKFQSQPAELQRTGVDKIYHVDTEASLATSASSDFGLLIKVQGQADNSGKAPESANAIAGAGVYKDFDFFGYNVKLKTLAGFVVKGSNKVQVENKSSAESAAVELAASEGPNLNNQKLEMRPVAGVELATGNSTNIAMGVGVFYYLQNMDRQDHLEGARPQARIEMNFSHDLSKTDSISLVVDGEFLEDSDQELGGTVKLHYRRAF